MIVASRSCAFPHGLGVLPELSFHQSVESGIAAVHPYGGNRSQVFEQCDCDRLPGLNINGVMNAGDYAILRHSFGQIE
jgi:hypothetical protein